MADTPTGKMIATTGGANTARKYTFRTSSQAWWQISQYLPNPDRVLTRRGQSIALYKEMLSDSHLTACLDSRESATLARDWAIDRGDCPKRIYDIIYEWFFSILERKSSVEDLSRDEFLSNIMDVVYYGYQPAELSWDLFRGLWVPIQIVPKPPEWFIWFIREDGVPELRFLSRTNPIDGEPPPDQFTMICPRIKATFDNPYGRGVATRCFWPIVFKRAGIEFWMNFMERFGTPWVKGTITAGATTTELTDFAHDLRHLVQDAVIAISGNRTVELLESQKMSGENGFRDLEDFMDSQISKTILGHTLSTDATSKGSYAATRGAMVVRGDLIKRDTQMLKNIFADIINLIFIRNGYVNKPRPVPRPYNADDVNTDRATRDEALSRTGVKFSKKYYMRTYSLQEDDIDEIVDVNGKQVTGLDTTNKNPDPAEEQRKKQQQKEGDDKRTARQDAT